MKISNLLFKLLQNYNTNASWLRLGEEIVLKPMLDVEKFIAELRGCVRGSRIRPRELKEIWGVKHAHH